VQRSSPSHMAASPSGHVTPAARVVTGIAPQRVAYGTGARRPDAHAAIRALSRLHLELVALLAGTALLYVWKLAQNSWANEFYSAAVRSMSSGGHNFLYASFDPTGVMTTDKPPLALWVQTASVDLFGYRPLSILVPQVVIGVATVGLVYDLTRRRFGRGAGFIAGLVLATTPITVAVSRNNNPDALLVLCCVAALWCFVRGLDSGRTLWIVLAGVSVGLGFETKWAVALLVVPGIAAGWLWVAQRGRAVAFGQLLQAGAAAVAVGAAWPLLVALTPTADRPWLGSTSDNSIFSLITGFNGLDRIAAPTAGPASGDAPGPFRLLNADLGGQAGWLLGFAIAGAIAIVAATRLRRADARSGWLIAVAGAFVTTAIAFSTANGTFHPYYISLLAPFTAMLVGAGARQIVEKVGLAAPLAVTAGALTEVIVIHNNPQQLGSLGPFLLAGAVVIAAALLAVRALRGRAALVTVALAGLLIAPATWAIQTDGHPGSPSHPAGGPAGADAIGGPVARQTPARHVARKLSPGQRALIDERELHEVLHYVRRHGGGALGIQSQLMAEPAIVATGAHIAGLGGFTGTQSNPTVAWFASAVHSGRIRWVLVHSHRHAHRAGPMRVSSAAAAACRRVPAARYSTRVRVRGSALYDCHGRARALEIHAASHGGLT
jgi:4-amino-4-deoxy-L-arabinose transferase-like glycosyltransferase